MDNNEPLIVETFRSESANGVPVSVLKSAIQKYARRKMLSEGLAVLGLCSYFTATRITTNIVNRLVVIMSEEINIHETMVPVLMMQLHQRYASGKDPSVWLEMYTLLCRSRKCRLVSDVKTRWNLPPYKMELSRLDQLHKVLLQQHGIKTGQVDRTETGDPGRVVANFEKGLDARDWDVTFTALRVILRQPTPPRGFEKDLWKTVQAAAERADTRLTPVITALKYFHGKMKHAERPIYLIHAVLLILHAPALGYESPLNCAVPETLNHWRKEGVSLALRSFPDFVIDRHTTLARGQSAVTFAEVGAYIPDEDKRFMSNELRSMYLEFKHLQEGKSGP